MRLVTFALLLLVATAATAAPKRPRPAPDQWDVSALHSIQPKGYDGLALGYRFSDKWFLDAGAMAHSETLRVDGKTVRETELDPFVGISRAAGSRGKYGAGWCREWMLYGGVIVADW